MLAEARDNQTALDISNLLSRELAVYVSRNKIALWQREEGIVHEDLIEKTRVHGYKHLV